MTLPARRISDAIKQMICYFTIIIIIVRGEGNFSNRTCYLKKDMLLDLVNEVKFLTSRYKNLTC